MTQFRIARPSCDSVMKLIDRNGQPQKVRCPRCDTLFRAEPNTADEPSEIREPPLEDSPKLDRFRPMERRFRRKRKQPGRRGFWVGVGIGVGGIVLTAVIIAVIVTSGTFSGAAATTVTNPKPPAAEGWREVASKKGQFKVQMPGAPTEVSDSQPGATGEPVPQTKFTLTAPDDTVYYLSIMDFSDKELKARSMADRYTAIRDSFVTKGQIHSEKAIQVKGYSGMELEASYSHAGKFIPVMLRHIPVGNRLYSLRVTKQQGSLNKDDVRKFFDSFELTEK